MMSSVEQAAAAFLAAYIHKLRVATDQAYAERCGES